MKKLFLSILLLSSISIQAGPGVAAFGYWASKSVMYAGTWVCWAVIPGTIAGAPGQVATIEATSTAIGTFLLSLPTV
jgi:hypothetical protein